MPLYDFKDIKRNIDHAYIVRGQDYLDKGYVLRTEPDNNGNYIFGEVKGSHRQLYKTNIEIFLEDNRAFD